MNSQLIVIIILYANHRAKPSHTKHEHQLFVKHCYTGKEFSVDYTIIRLISGFTQLGPTDDLWCLGRG